MRRLLSTLCLLSLSGCISLLTRPGELECNGEAPTCDGNTLVVCIDGIEFQQDCGAEVCDAAGGACVELEPGCGNGVTEPGLGEQCDDGNIANGDGCSATCQTEGGADCGNGLPEAGEQCDDGNASNNDACTNACLNARCGDNFIRTGVEQCDDGNTSNGDGCSAACQTENNNCGNGTVNAGEECDDGNNINTDACKNNCQAAECGDGVVQSGVEQCDDGNANNNDSCRNNCTLQTCGNGVVNAGEECDDGNQTAGDFLSDFCDPNCQNPGCGNGFLGNFQAIPGFPGFPESCDDGNLANGDGCDSSCFIESNAVCGNGTVESGEACDDGNTSNGDGCSSVCQTEGGAGTCQSPINISAGTTSDSTAGEANNLTGSCTGGQASELVYRFVPSSSGTLTITLQSATDQGFYVRTSCQNGTDLTCQDAFAGGTNEVGQLSVTGGVPLFVIVDGFTANDPGPFSLTLSLSGGGAVCGNGTVEAGEQCDDGNATTTDACVVCQNAVCGDGFVRSGFETCDDDNTVSGDGCSATCQTENNNGSSCQAPIFVGLGSVSNDTTDATNIVAGSCQASVQAGGGTGGDQVFRFTASSTGTRTFTITSTGANGDHGIILYGINNCGSTTELGCVDAVFGQGEVETINLSMTNGQSIFIIISAFAPSVDIFNPGSEGPFTLTIQ
jgi:cysteine-rich repeat protein